MRSTSGLTINTDLCQTPLSADDGTGVIEVGKQIWRDFRELLHGAAVQAVAKLVAGLLAILGGLTVVEPQAAVDVRNAALLQQPEVVAPKP